MNDVQANILVRFNPTITQWNSLVRFIPTVTQWAQDNYTTFIESNATLYKRHVPSRKMLYKIKKIK